jgi:hypothetical protein
VRQVKKVEVSVAKAPDGLFADRRVQAATLAAFLLVVGIGGYAGYGVWHERAQAAQVSANRGRVENAWLVAVGAHSAYMAQLKASPKNQLAPYVASAKKIATQLEAEIATFKDGVPHYADNPTLAALVTAMQDEAAFYRQLPDTLAQTSWDSTAAVTLTQKLRSTESKLREVQQQLPTLSPGLAADFAELGPLQAQVEHQGELRKQAASQAAKVRQELLAYANAYDSIRKRYDNTRDDMQRFADQIRAGHVWSRMEAISEFRRQQEARMGLRDELSRLRAPDKFLPVHDGLAACFSDSLRAIDAAIQAMVALGNDQGFDVAYYWTKFQEDSRGISERLAGIDNRYRALRQSI